MKQSWNSRLTPAQTKVVSAIYGQARVEEGLYSSMRDLILMSKAPGTIHLYTTSISRWNSYASSNGYRIFPPVTRDFAAYVTDLSEKKSSFTVFKNLGAAIPFYYAARNCNELVVTKMPYIKLLLGGAMRAAAKRRGPVRKAETLDQSSVQEVLIQTCWPSGSEFNPNTSLKDWRTATRLYTYYKSMCRWDCYRRLSPASFNFQTDHLIITFVAAKNDQFYSGSSSVLAYKPGDLLCPRLMYTTYFRMMDFAMMEGEILNCRLSKTGKSRPLACLSYGSSLADTKELLARFGHRGKFSEKSFKASAVSITLDKGTPITDVQVYGRWLSDRTPLAYHNSSIPRRAAISLLL